MSGPESQSFEFGEFRLDSAKRLLTRDGETLALTPKVFDLLSYLVQNKGRLIEKDELMSSIWPDTIVEENNLSQNISILRQILGEKRGEHRFIATIPGRGYKFVAEVNKAGDSAAKDDDKAESESPTTERVNAKTRESVPINTSRLFGFITLAAIAILFFGLVGIYLWKRNAASDVSSSIKTIAVLPFKPLVAENRDEALEMGMADTLIAKLGGSNDKIIVRPLGSVRRFGGMDQDPRKAGEELGVELVLDGSIQHWGEKIRVNVQLIYTLDGRSLWTGTFDEKQSDIFAVQDTIAGKVADALKLKLSEKETRGTENVEAYRLYLQGRYYAAKSTPAETRKGIEFYQRAVDTDPLFARAYAGMADAYRSLPITSDVPPNEAFPQAKASIKEALKIDENLIEAHIVSGWVTFWYDWDFVNSETELKKAVETDPNNSEAHRAYSLVLTVLGRHDESVNEMKRARELDPLSLITNALEGQSLFYAERYGEAIDRLNKTLEIEPNYWVAHVILAKVFIQQNRFDEAVAEAEKAKQFSGGNSETDSLAGYALAKSGRTADAFAKLKELETRSQQQYVPAYNIALIYNGLGRKEEALNKLEKAFSDHDARVILLGVDPKWDNLRSEPRFVNIVKRMSASI